MYYHSYILTCNQLYTAIMCPLLMRPENGIIFVTGQTVGSRATYFCNNGFTRVGLLQRTCTGNGDWGGEEPTCICKFLGNTFQYTLFVNNNFSLWYSIYSLMWSPYLQILACHHLTCATIQHASTLVPHKMEVISQGGMLLIATMNLTVWHWFL